MNPQIMAPDSLISLSGALMSLFGLLVSLFSVHLGNWLGKLKALRAKWEANSGSTDDELKVKRECRYSHLELYSWQPFVMTGLLIGFSSAVLFFFYDVKKTCSLQYPSIFIEIYTAFFIIMPVLSITLLIGGWRIGKDLKNKIKTTFPIPPG